MVGRALAAAGFATAEAAAWLPAMAHRAALNLGLRQRRGSAAEDGIVSLGRLHDVWFARLCRELFAWPSRAGLGPALARRVAWDPPNGERRLGCVYAICSTPWCRVLAAWAARRPDLHLLIHGHWARRTGPTSVGGGTSCLRQLLARLRNGQSVGVIADALCIRRTCPVTFLGRRVRGSLVGARLAAAASVPLVPTVFAWDRGVLRPRFGAPLYVDRDRESQAAATAAALRFLEIEIRRSPAVWNKALKPPELW